MFLLRTKAKHIDLVKMFDDYNEAVEAAREFVGDHHAIDGCSTPRAESTYPDRKFVVSRSTSFGQRQAWVIPCTMFGLKTCQPTFDLTGA